MKKLIKKIFMKKIFRKKGFYAILLMVATSSLLLSSCHKELEPFNGDSTIRLSYSFDSATRANATVYENNISKIALLFYTNDAAGTYVGHSSCVVNSTGSSTGTSGFTIPPEMTHMKKYKVLAMVSGDSKFYDDLSMDLFLNNLSANKLTYSDMIDNIYLKRTTTMSPLLPFCGTSIFDYTGTGNASLSVVFTRTVAKITLANETDNFRLKWAKVGVYQTSGYMFHQDLYKNDIALGTGTGVGISPSGKTINEGLYAFPNMVAVTAQNDMKTTCLIVAGYYREMAWGSDVPQGEPTYYRINISRGNGKSQLLKRNNQYNLTITSVSGHGDTGEDDAIKQPDNKINVSINDWGEDNDDEIIITPDGYLSYSPTYLDLQSIVNDVRYIDIKVKEGTYWDWTLTSGANHFIVKKDEANVNRLSVKTALDGDETLTRFGKIEIKVYKSNVDPKVPLDKLEGVVNLIQYSKIMDNDILSVDGKLNNFAIEAKASGEVFKFEVLTGSQQNLWAVKLEEGGNIASWCSASPGGGNGSMLHINVSANSGLSAAGRTGELTISFVRGGSGGAGGVADDANMENVTTPPPIKITITQKPTDFDIDIYPLYSNDKPLVVEGINLDVLSAGNGSTYYNDFLVNTMDAKLYTHYKVTSEAGIDKKYLAITTADATSYPSTPHTKAFKSGDVFRLMVKQTVPMSDIKDGGIKIEPCNASGVVYTEARPYSFPVKIISNHVALPEPMKNLNLDNSVNPADTTGHAWIKVGTDVSTDGRMYIYDRNAGVLLNNEQPIALHYSSIYPLINPTFKGPQVTFTQVSDNSMNVDGLPVTVCHDGWGIPTKAQWELIAPRLTASDHYVFGISDGVNKVGKPIAFHLPHWRISGGNNYHGLYHVIQDKPLGVTDSFYWKIETSGTSKYERINLATTATVRCVHVLPPPPSPLPQPQL